MMSMLRRSSGKDTRPHSHLECARALGLLTVCFRAGMTLSESAIVVWRNSKGEIRKLLEQALRKAALGSAKSLVETLEESSRNLPKRSEWASQPLIDLLRAESEPDTEQKHSLIEKAHESALRACRYSIRDDASSLRVPFSTIFAMGIVLPIIVATILPLWGMVSVEDIGTRNALLVNDMHAIETGTQPNIIALAGWLIILAFPALCILAANRLIMNREIISSIEMSVLANRLLIAFIFLITIALLTVSFFDGSTAFLLIMGAMIFLCVLTHRLLPAKSMKQQIADYSHSPSALGSICGRLSQGEHIVRAILLSIKNTGSNMKLLGAALIGEVKPDEHFISIRLIEEAASRDPRIAAKIFRQFSSHLSELDGIEREMRSELRPIAQSALVATMVLCPFVLGIVAGFNSFGISTNKNMAEEFEIKTVFAIFVMEMALAGYWLTTVLSPDRKELPKWLFDSRIMTFLSMIVFLGSVGFSETVFS